MATQKLSFLPIAVFSSQPFTSRSSDSCLSLPLSSFYGKKLLLRTSNLNRFFTKRHFSTSATVISPPTTEQEKAPTEKSPNWSARSIKSIALAELEARKLKYPHTGTESILMGILVEGTSQTAKLLRTNGITLFKVREETVSLLGRSEMYYFSPEHPPFTQQAKRALEWAIEEKLNSGESGEITTAYLLLGFWSDKDSAGHKILTALGFNDEKAGELAKCINDDILLTHK